MQKSKPNIQLAAPVKNEITPISLLEMAVTKGVDTTQLKELMDLQDRWEKKQAHKDFLDALSNFQMIVPAIKKAKIAKINSQKGSFSYKYADLGSIASSIKEALNKCGLSYRWEFEEINNKLKCKCFVSHRGGHTEITTMEAGKDNSGAKNEIQQTGSTQTYLQRYTLIGALGLSTAEEDNDGKSAPASTQTDEDREEILNQWKQAIGEINSKIELTRYYTKNKKAIDANKDIQAIMKTRQTELNGAKSSSTVTEMP